MDRCLGVSVRKGIPDGRVDIYRMQRSILLVGGFLYLCNEGCYAFGKPPSVP